MTAPAPPPLLDMSQVVIAPDCALALPATLARRRQLLPFVEVDGTVHVACANLSDRTGLDAARRHLGRPIHVEAAEPASLRAAIERVYGGPGTRGATRLRTTDARAASLDLEGEAAVTLVDELLRIATLQRASDIHLDPTADALRVRFRIDGKIEDYRTLPREVHAAVVGRLKVLGGLDIAERRAPQDGRFRQTVGAGDAAQRLDLRVATLPTRHGERVALRLLLLDAAMADFDDLGMSDAACEGFREAIARPFGLSLLTGPTGSGKTTTLYAALRELLSDRSLNILTVEDPIEYELPGVAQVEVTRGDKVSFHRALRHLLRHDPDVLMIGEIRDSESADVAIKSALTGHLVLSTLHANTAIGAVTRLLDLGVERYLVAATLRLAVAQRLVRRLCRHETKPRALTVAEAAALACPELANQEVADAVGCRYCGARGYIGRVGLFEQLVIDESWGARIVSGAQENELTAYRDQLGLPGLRADGVEKLLAGVTSPTEVISAVAAW